MSVSSLERQVLDSEAVCDGLRRQLDAGEDASARETELARQVFVRITFCCFDPVLIFDANSRPPPSASGNENVILGAPRERPTKFALADPPQLRCF